MTILVERMEVSGTAFRSAADAWFWTMRALRARRDGTGESGSGLQRPCDPDDVLRCLDRLCRDRRIAPRHARVLCRWGERQTAPDARSGPGDDMRLWHEALGRLDAPLRVKGIIFSEENKPNTLGNNSLTSYGGGV